MIKYTHGNQAELLNKAIPKFEKMNINQRLWKKDARLWKSEPDRKQQIVDRLGWLDIMEWMLPRVKEIESFSKQVLKDGIKTVVLLGMGGSSLCPEVLSEIMGIKKGCPKFYMLDSTDPEFIRNVETKLNLAKTLFIVSSKSGGTVETNSQFQYFYAKLAKLKKNQDIGSHFVAITDEGTSLQKLAAENQFRKVFINPSDIGGRYSALSYFGMVPAALMGINVTKFLNNAIAMKKSIQKSTSINNNPAITLGIICAELAKCGMDKMTLLLPGKLSSLGYWIEQLVAESTGKENLGVLPIEGEKIQAWDSYDNDRLFVAIRMKNEKPGVFDKKLNKLKDVGYSVIEITLDDVYDLAGEFYRWEIATAVMGIAFQIDPFDQPNVQSAKTLTSKILKDFEKKGKFPVEKPIFKSGNLSIYSNSKLWTTRKSWKHLEELLFDFLSTMQENDYVGILAYLAKSSPIQKQFDQWRDMLQKQLSIATVQGYGPSYLHSIGQLYKGGKNNGLFIEFTIQESKDLKVPKAPYTFGELKSAQAMGDYQALQEAKRRVIRVELGKNYKADLKKFETALLNLLSHCQCSCNCEDCEGEK